MGIRWSIAIGVATGIVIGSNLADWVNNYRFAPPVQEAKPAPTVVDENPLSYTEADVKCLAKNIFGEARNLDIRGQLWVAAVTINRALDPRFPHTVCGVVHQDYAFSWRLGWKQQIKPFKNKRLQREKITAGAKLINARAMQKAEEIARFALSHQDLLPNKEVLFYHDVRIKPKWAKQKLLVKVVDKQAFYAWPQG